MLGIAKGASEDEIKKAYRKMALKYHPDKVRASNGLQSESLLTSQRLHLAYLPTLQHPNQPTKYLVKGCADRIGPAMHSNGSSQFGSTAGGGRLP